MKSTHRGFTLRNSMILIAAIAAAIPWTRSVITHALFFRETFFSATQYFSTFHVNFQLALIVPGLICLCAALALMRLFGDRPSLRTLLHQPGFLALFIASLILALIFIKTPFAAIIREIYDPPPRRSLNILGYWEQAADHLIAIVGRMVAFSWAVIAISRGWRRSTDTFERVGRIAGVFWITLALIRTVLKMATL